MLVKCCRKFTWALIDNQWICSGVRMNEEEEVMLKDKHGRVMAPLHAKEYCNHQWVCDAVSRYQHYVCRVYKCKKQIRTCCWYIGCAMNTS